MGFKGASSATHYGIHFVKQRLFSEKFYLRSWGGLQLALVLTLILALSGCLGGADSGNSKELSAPAGVDNLSAINIANVSSYGLAGSCRDVAGELRVLLINESSTQEVKSDALDCSSEGAWAVELNATSLNEGTIKVVVSHEDASANVRKYPQGEVVKDVTAPLAPTMTTASKINQGNFRQYGLGGNCGEEGQVIGVELRDSAATVNVARPENAVMCSSGAWSAKINTTNLLDGAIRITLVLKDLAGNLGTATIAHTKDIVAPTVAVTTLEPYIIASTQEAYALSGDCSEAQSEVRVSLANPGDASSAVTPSSQPRCQENNTWATTLNASTLPQGSLTITVSHQDDVENEQTHSQTVTKDTVVPELVINALDAINAQTSEATLRAYTIEGTCSEGDRVITVGLTDSAAKLASPGGTVTCPPQGGNWSVPFDITPLANGILTASARYSDVAGNVKVAAQQTVVKDTQRPTASISARAPNILAATQASYSVSGTCSENGRNVTVTLADGSQTLTPNPAVTCSSKQWTAGFNATALSEGNVTIAVVTQDAAGNASAPVTKTVVKDTVVPITLTFSSDPLPVINLGNVSAYSLSGTCSEGDSAITVALTDSAEKTASPSETVTCPAPSGGSWSAQFDASSLAEGAVTASAQYSDVAGNVKVAAQKTVVKDTQLPTASISASAPNVLAATQASYSVSGTCSENGRSVTVTLADGSQTLNSSAAVVCSSRQWTASFNATALSEGNVTIAVATQDAAGNASAPVTKVVVKDTRLPTLSLAQGQPTNITLSNSEQYVLQGSCGEEGQEVGVELRDSAGAANIARPAAAVPCTSGSWRAEVNAGDLWDGAISIVLSFADQGGNPAAIATINPVVKDTVAPWVTVNAPRHIFGPAGTTVSYQLQGGCSEAGRDVVVTVATMVQTVSCRSGAWTANFSIPTSVGVGPVAIIVSHLDSLLNAATFSPISVERSSSTVQISLGSAPIINRSNMGSYALTGDCAPDGGAIALVLGGVSKTPSCTSSRWSASFDFGSLNVADSDALAITLGYTEGGNQAPSVSTAVIKDTIAPRVTLMGANSINKVTRNYYVVSGECSENTRPVILSVVDSVATALTIDGPPICSNGKWSLGLDVSSLAEGSVTLAATLVDRAGNAVATPDKVVAKNTQIPVVSISESVPNILAATTQASYSVSGGCSEDGQNVTVTLTGGGQTISPSATVSCNAQQWTASFNATALSEGNVEISAMTQNSSSTTSASVTKTVIKDITPPTTLAFGSGPLPVVNASNVSAYALSGTCSEGGSAITLALTDSVEKTASPSETVTCPAPSGGNWSAQLDASSLAEGSITASAQYSDVAGNVKVATPQTVVKDTQLPTASISASAPNISAATQASYSVSGPCSENGQSVTVTLADGSQTLAPSAAVVCSSEQWTAGFNPTALSEGNVTIAVATQDAAGNISVSVTKTVVKDTVPPATLTFSQGSLPVINASNVSAYSLSGTCSEGDRVITLALTDSAKKTALPGETITCPTAGGNWSAQFDASFLAEGSVAVSAQYSDVAGNVKVATPQTVEKDTQRPTVSISASAPNISAATQASYSVSGTCSENGQSVTVTLADDSQTLSPSASVSCSSKQWTAGFDATSLAEGSVTIAAATQDSSENASFEVVKNIVKDVTLPTLTLSQNPLPAINASNLITYSLSGTCSEQGQEVTLQIENNQHGVSSNRLTIATQPSCTSNGQWSLPVDASRLADTTGSGGYVVSITITHSDQAGNPRVLSAKTAKDSTMPTVQITTFAPYIMTSTQAAYAISGTCSEEQREITVSLVNPSDVATTATPSTQPVCQTGDTWATTVNASTLGEGAITIAVRHKDGFENEQTHSQTVTKDTLVPNLAINALSVINAATPAATLSAYPVTGTCSEGERAITVSLTDSAGAVVSPGGAINCSSSGGSWSAQLAISSLADGTLTASARYSDVAGNVRIATPQTVAKDTQLPVLTVRSLNNIFTLNQGSFLVGGTCSEIGKDVTIRLTSDGTGVGVATLDDLVPTSCTASGGVNGEWRVTGLNVSTLRDGTITITASQGDDAQNSGSITQTVSKASASAVGITVSLPPHINKGNAGSYSLSGSCSPDGQNLSITVGNVSPGTAATCSSSSWTATFNLSSLVDSPAVAIVASYSSGSQTATYPGANVIKDVSDPQLTLSAPGNIDRINAGNYALEGTCSEVSRVISITLVDSNSTTVNSRAICVNKSGNKQWAKEIDAQTLGAGSVTVTATHSDEAGNAATHSAMVSRRDVVIIAIASNQPDIQPSNEESYLVSGTCSELTHVVAVTFVDSDSANADVTAEAICTNYAWTTAGVDVSGAPDGSVEIRALHRTVNAPAVTVSKLACVASDVAADSSIGTSAENPIIICDYSGLKAIATQGLGKHYKLGKDIDAQASWSEGATNCGAYDGTDIATESPCKGMTQLGSFSGSLDGDGHIIERLYLHNGGGLFSVLQNSEPPGLIKNVHLRKLRVVNISSAFGSHTGGLVDYAQGGSGLLSVIDSCSVQGKISGSGSVGGLIGQGRGEIYNSYAKVEVRGRLAGGLVGSGGIGSVIVSSYARGSVQGNGSGYSLVGGLVGSTPSGVIRNSYADVAVSQGTHQGSIAGNFFGTISKSYGVGRVSGTGENTGGLLGYVDNHDGGAYLPDTFWDTQTTDQADSDGEDGEPTTNGGLATANMQLACAAGVTTGICALGSGFFFTENAYPKVKKCIGACDTDNPIFGTELVGGQ